VINAEDPPQSIVIELISADVVKRNSVFNVIWGILASVILAFLLAIILAEFLNSSLNRVWD